MTSSNRVHPPPPETKGACFQCQHFLGLAAESNAGRCGCPGKECVIARPEMGCAYWTLDPRRPPEIRTTTEWEGVYGRPIQGFDDGLEQTKWPWPMDGRRIRQIYEAAPSEEARKLAWEIARLHDLVQRIHQSLTAIARAMPHTPARSNLLRLAELIGQEPGVRDAKSTAKARYRK